MRKYDNEEARKRHNYYLANKEKFLTRAKKSQRKINAMRVRSTTEDGVTTLRIKYPTPTIEEERLLRHDIKTSIYRLIKGNYIVSLEGCVGYIMYKVQEDSEIVKVVTDILDNFVAKKEK